MIGLKHPELIESQRDSHQDEDDADGEFRR
jgi:hypothetical protein